jgi:hypothetical protein
MSWSIPSECFLLPWLGADRVGALSRDDRVVLSIMNHECYMPGLDASAGYITVLVEQTKVHREWTWKSVLTLHNPDQATRYIQEILRK